MSELDNIERGRLREDFQSITERMHGTSWTPEEIEAKTSLLIATQKQLSGPNVDQTAVNVASNLLAILSDSIDKNIEEKLEKEKNALLATKDGLTGLPNKIGIWEAANTVVSNSQRLDQSVAIFYLDLDNFKPINDTLGHSEGDRALKKVAHTLKESVRSGDIVGRDGGDEFVVIMINQDKDHSFEGEKEKLESIFTEGLDYKATNGQRFSIGCSVGMITVAEGESAKAAIARADTLMYREKQIKKRALETPEASPS